MNAYEVKTQALWKVMAAYHSGDNLKSLLWLTACTLGSSPVPVLGNEYRRTVHFLHSAAQYAGSIQYITV